MSHTTLSPDLIDALTAAVDDLGRLLEHTGELDGPTATAISDTLDGLIHLTQPDRPNEP